MLDLSSINFKDIYCTDEAAALQSDRYANAVSAFKKAFEDKEPEVIVENGDIPEAIEKISN